MCSSRRLLILAVSCCVSVAATDLATYTPKPINQVAEVWQGTTPRHLHKEYYNIFRHGNRNAASHLWSTFLLERSAQMTDERLELMFSGYCAVSGSPVGPNDYNRYKLTLPLASGVGNRTGYMHYCCWPCVCDTQDFIRVDTRTVRTLDGEKKLHFAVIGNPCRRAEQLDVEFIQPFGTRLTTLRHEAPEVRCGPGGELLGATMSDHGHVIISRFFDLGDGQEGQADAVVAGTPQPGRVTTVAGVLVQDEYEWGPHCSDRAAQGYNSGMGEIFRKVAEIAPVQIPAALGPPKEKDETCAQDGSDAKAAAHAADGQTNTAASQAAQ